MGQNFCGVVMFPKGFAHVVCRNFMQKFMYNSGILDSIYYAWLSKLRSLWVPPNSEFSVDSQYAFAVRSP